MLVTRVRLPACAEILFALTMELNFIRIVTAGQLDLTAGSWEVAFSPKGSFPTRPMFLLQAAARGSRCGKVHEPPVGIEPTTIRLRSACSAS